MNFTFSLKRDIMNGKPESAAVEQDAQLYSLCICLQLFMVIPPPPHTHTYTYARVHTPPPPPPTHWHHQLFSSTSFQSLIYLSQSWSVPSARLWVGGALGMTQRVPFPSSGRVTSFNSSLLDTGGLVVEDFEIRNILSAYNRRNGRHSTTCWGWVSNIP